MLDHFVARFAQRLKIRQPVRRTAAPVGVERLESRVVLAGAGAFTDSLVVSGLTAPVAAKIAPDGRIFVAERSGVIKVFDGFADNTATVFADLRSQVHNAFDRGLLGLTLDPKFTTGRPYVYVLYTYDGDIGGPSPKFGSATSTTDPAPNATSSGAKASGRLTRLTAEGDRMKPGSEKVLIADWQQQFPSHSVGTVAFGPDGALYASAGDAASFNNPDFGQNGNPFNDPLKEGGALRSQDILSDADPTTLDGTVIRVNPDTGAAAAGNPYATSIDANKRRVVAFGLRNPFRFTFRPGTNEVWLGDVGWIREEEIDRIVMPTDAKVENFGWPAYEGRSVNNSYKNENLPLLKPLYDDPTKVTKPFFAYGHYEKVVPGSNEPTGGSSVTGLAFYQDGAYPDAYNGALFFADYSRKQIYVMYKGADGLPDPATRAVFKATGGGATQLFTGPGGDLFYVDLVGGALRRISYSAGTANRAPTAAITADKTTGATPLNVKFSGAGSRDLDGDALQYAWDLDGDGAYDDSTLVNPSFTYTTASPKTVRLKVTDTAGASGVASLVLRAGDTAPKITLTPPASNWAVGQTLYFSATATDAEDGALPPSAFLWTLDLLHDNLIDPANSHVHQLQTFEDVKSGSFVAPDHEYPSRLRLTVTVTDSAGVQATQSVILTPRTVKITIASEPAGIEFSVNGNDYAAPGVVTMIANGNATVSAPPTQTIDGVEYSFTGWSDGGTGPRTFAAAADRTLRALYAAKPAAGALPRIEAEDFNPGGQGVGYSDTDPKNLGGKYRIAEGVDVETTTDAGGGFDVAYVRVGEWLRYDIDVPTAGRYSFQLRVATAGAGAKVAPYLDGKGWAGDLTLPNTGGNQKWQTLVVRNLPLTAGKHTIRLTALKSVTGSASVANFNWLQLVSENAPAARANLTATYPGNTPFAGVPITPAVTTALSSTPPLYLTRPTDGFDVWSDKLLADRAAEKQNLFDA